MRTSCGGGLRRQLPREHLTRRHVVLAGCGRLGSQRRHWSSRRRLRALPPLDGRGFRRWRWWRRLEFGQDRVRFELGGRHVDECAFLHRYGSDRDGQRQISVEHIGHRKSLVGGDRQRAWRAAEAAARGARFCTRRAGLDRHRSRRMRIEQIDARYIQIRQVRIHRAARERGAAYRSGDRPGHFHARPLGATRCAATRCFAVDTQQ